MPLVSTSVQPDQIVDLDDPAPHIANDDPQSPSNTTRSFGPRDKDETDSLHVGTDNRHHEKCNEGEEADSLMVNVDPKDAGKRNKKGQSSLFTLLGRTKYV